MCGLLTLSRNNQLFAARSTILSCMLRRQLYYYTKLPKSWGIEHPCPKFWGVRTPTIPIVAVCMVGHHFVQVILWTHTAN